MERLQRVIAARGVSSRRSAEELIASGHVSVNGQVVTELGTRVDPASAEIRIDGKLLKPQVLRTILLNKPSGYITTMADERDRRTVMELVQTRERLFPVGRLDRDTEGLLLLTNDGELANRIMHPRYQLAKEYHVVTPTRPSDRILQRIRDGVRIDGRLIVPDEIRLLRETRDGIVIKLVIHEGFYHAVRRLMEAANIPVKRLRRHRIGPISLQGVEQGEWRELTPGELAQLAEAVHLDREDDRPSMITATDETPEQVRPAAEPRRERGPARSDRDHDRDRDRDRDRKRGGDDRSRPGGGQKWQQQRPAAAGGRRNDSVRRTSETFIDRTERQAPSRDPGRATVTTGPAPRRVRPLQRERQGEPNRTVTRPPTTRPAAAPAGSPRVEMGTGRFEMVGGRRTDGVVREYRPSRPAASDSSDPPDRPTNRRPGQREERGAQRSGDKTRDGQRQKAGRNDRPNRPRTEDLDTVGRRSRHRVTDDEDAKPTRIKRRSPHSHSHRGRKPKPVAGPSNTTMKKARDTNKPKGGSRGRRR